jgi:CheY-like chemotaxis protein
VALLRPTVRSRGLPTAATTRPSPLDSGRRARTWPRHPVPDVDGPVSPSSPVPGVDGSPAPAADPTRQRWAARNRVLIVDDHGPFRSIAGQLLTADGFVVVGEAADGAAAIRACAQLHPDIVVLDVQLPDLDGFAVAALLTTRAAAPVVVLVSSRSRADYGSRIVECGARGYLAKAELSGRALRRLLSSAQPTPPAL